MAVYFARAATPFRVYAFLPCFLRYILLSSDVVAIARHAESYIIIFR